MIRKAAMSLLAVVLAAIAGFGVASPARAAAVSCSSGYICFFENSDGTGLLEAIQVSFIQRSVCRKLGTYSTNRTSYIANRSPELFHVYNGTTCSDSTVGTIWPNSSGPMNSTWNDVISSYFKA